MTTMSDIYPRRLDLGRVVQRTVEVLGRQPAPIFGLALLLHGVPSAYRMYGLRRLFEDDSSPFFVFQSPLFWGHGIVGLLLGAFLEATLVAVALAALSNRPLEPREVLAAGGKFFLPLFAVNLLALIGVAFGCILLVVPGIILALAWAVAGPALMVEPTGITGAFGRSAELTRDNRWRLFALLVLWALASSVIGDSSAYHHSFRWDTPMDFIDMAFSPVRIGVRAVFGSLLYAVGITALAVIYVELRTVKEGQEPDLSGAFS